MPLSNGSDPGRDGKLQPDVESEENTENSELERLGKIDVPSVPPLPPPPDISYQRRTFGSPGRPDSRVSQVSQPDFPTKRKIVVDRLAGQAPQNNGAQNIGSYGAELSAGITFGASVIVGFLLGHWLDGRLHLSFPWGTVLLGFAGIAAGFINLFRLLAIKDRRNRKK